VLGGGEIEQVMFAQGAVGLGEASGFEDGFGDLVGAAWFDKPYVLAWQHGRDRAPLGGDDRDVVRERLDEHQRLAFVLIIGGETKDVALGKELELGLGVGEADKAHGGAELDGVALKSFLGLGAVERAGDGQSVGAGGVGVEQAHRFQGVEEAFVLATQSYIEEFEAFVGLALAGGWEHAGVGEGVLHDGDAFGQEWHHIFGEFFGEHDGEIGVAEEFLGDAAFELGRFIINPGAEAVGVPVQDELGEEGAAEGHDHPVAVERAAFGRCGYIIERHRAVLPADAEHAKAGDEERDDFLRAPAADVGGVRGELEIDVMQLKALAVAAEFFEQKANHGALAVVGWWCLGEYEQFHCRAG